MKFLADILSAFALVKRYTDAATWISGKYNFIINSTIPQYSFQPTNG